MVPATMCRKAMFAIAVHHRCHVNRSAGVDAVAHADDVPLADPPSLVEGADASSEDVSAPDEDSEAGGGGTCSKAAMPGTRRSRTNGRGMKASGSIGSATRGPTRRLPTRVRTTRRLRTIRCRRQPARGGDGRGRRRARRTEIDGLGYDWLSWVPPAPTSSYVFVRKVPGLAHQYSIVNGTSLTPPAAPGMTVNYSVRTNVTGSACAPEVSIATRGSTTV